MACITVTPNLSPAQLSTARDALVARINDTALRAQRRADMPGMPSGLVAASCFLADHGVTAPACDGEFFFNWDTATSRQFLDGLSPDARAHEIEQGRKVLFEGRRAICAGVLDTAAALDAAADTLAETAVSTVIVADALRARWAVNAARRAAPANDREAA